MFGAKVNSKVQYQRASQHINALRSSPRLGFKNLLDDKWITFLTKRARLLLSQAIVWVTIFYRTNPPVG
jgi:hypothetical protein